MRLLFEIIAQCSIYVLKSDRLLADESDADGAGLERRRQFIAVSGRGIAILFVLPELEEGDDHNEAA